MDKEPCQEVWFEGSQSTLEAQQEQEGEQSQETGS